MVSIAAPLGLVAAAVILGENGGLAFKETTTLVLCDLIIVCGLQVFIGNSGVYSFGQIAFSSFGAYAAALCTLPLSFVALQTPGLPGWIGQAQPGPLVAALVGIGTGAFVAALIGLALIRGPALVIPIATFAFLLVANNVVANAQSVTGGSGGLVGIPRTSGPLSAGLWAAAAVVIALAFKFSALGYRLRATRENEIVARSLGIRVMPERLAGFVLSGALCGLGGALAVHESGVLSPASFYFAATVTTLTMLIVGGTGSVLGAVVGTFAVATVNELLRDLEEGGAILGISLGQAPGLAAIGLGVMLLATMITRPTGLSGGREAGELKSWKGTARHKDRAVSVRIVQRQTRTSHALSPTEAQLQAKGVSLAFSGLRVLDGVSLTLGHGEALGLIGPNGAGKTSLVNVLSGYQRPDTGLLEVDRNEFTGCSPAQVARLGIVRSFQAALPFPQMSALESVATGALGIGCGKQEATAVGWELLHRVGLSDQAATPGASLPAGSQRLLGVARALAARPRYLLLDEPAAGLNDIERAELVSVLRGILVEFGCGILLIEHDVGVVMDLCQRIQVLDGGVTIALGTPTEVQQDPRVIRAYLGPAFANEAHA